MRFAFLLFAAIALLFAVAVEGQRRVCQPGSVFNVLCNTCRCNRDGTDMACTRKECPAELSEFDQYFGRKRRMCQPGTFFKMDCNDCRCNNDGTNAACTLKACVHG